MAAKETAEDSVKSDDGSFADWMGKLPDRVLDVPLLKLSIPGSHNSGTYALRKEYGMAPDADQAIKNLASIPFIASMAHDIIFKYSKCQNLPILKQLEGGIRFLDMHVALHEPSGELHVIHSMFGPTVSECMEDVKTFLQKHRGEVVLIDFNHFYDMELEHHLQLITYLMFVFDGMLCPYSSPSDLMLRSLVEKDKRVVVFYNDSSVLEFEDFWPNNPSIFSVWANTMDEEKCLATLEQRARERDVNRFLVCQAVLTPDIATIMSNLQGSVHSACAKKVNPRCVDWLKGDQLKEHRGAVYTIDFVEECDFVKSVIALCDKCAK